MNEGQTDQQVGDARIHRALASPVRQQILAVLRGKDPQGVHALAQHLGLHANTVRAHLTVLEKAGLVVSRPQGRDRPGRPRLTYHATDDADMRDTDEPRGDGYRFLAGILASYLTATAADPSDAAEEAGAGWGRYLVDRPGPFQRIEPRAAVERIVALLDQLGFAPELDDGDPATPRVLLRRCPFLDVAREHQQVVCGIHLGLMRGALDELGVDVQVRDLLPFVEPGLCVSHLSVPA